MLRDTDLLPLLMNRKRDHSLPREMYTDPSLFQIDMERIWYKSWLFAVPACELPKAGSYVTHTVGQYSVLIVRGNDGVVRAFHNTCRHRGSTLCRSAKGTNPKIVCPYHQWTYDLDGRLQWARDMGPDFDSAQYGLKPIHCQDISGLIYICLANEAPPVEAFAAQAVRYLTPHNLANSKVAYESTIIEKGNWKLVWENNRECYHCSANHPSLCRTFPEDPRIWNSGEEGLSSILDQHVKRCEAVGAPSAFHIDPQGGWRFVRMPLLGSAESYTMDGKAAVAKPSSTLPFKDAGALLKFNYPSTWNHFLADHSIVFRVTPVSATETEVCTKWLVHKDAQEGKDYDLTRLTEVWISTNDEDRIVVENNQRGILSMGYEPGPYSAVQEDGVIQFINWYAETLTGSIAGHRHMAAE